MDTALIRGTAIHGVRIVVQHFMFWGFRQVRDLFPCDRLNYSMRCFSVMPYSCVVGSYTSMLFCYDLLFCIFAREIDFYY
jgi:hypothetical protein